jgi:hypothetical protein
VSPWVQTPVQQNKKEEEDKMKDQINKNWNFYPWNSQQYTNITKNAHGYSSGRENGNDGKLNLFLKGESLGITINTFYLIWDFFR